MSPFAIHKVKFGAGWLALSPLPGRNGNLAHDVEVVAEWGAELVLSMTTLPEMEVAGTAELAEQLRKAAIAWRHLPVDDFGTPGEVVEQRWPEVASEIRTICARGGSVLIHCMGGCGRSGMAILRLLVESGEDAPKALARLRNVRPCAVETDSQMEWALTAVRNVDWGGE